MMNLALTSGIEMFIYAALSLLSLVSMWIVFEKAGRKGWESLIPVRNLYVLFKIAGKKHWFRAMIFIPILWLIVSLVTWTIPFTMDSSIFSIVTGVNWILGLATIVVSLLAWVTLPYGITKKFGQSTIFYIGMLFLTPILLGVLAFTDVKYEEKETKSYNWRTPVLIIAGISLLLGCYDGLSTYNEYKDFLSYYDYEDDYFYKNNDYEEENENNKITQESEYLNENEEDTEIEDKKGEDTPENIENRELDEEAVVVDEDEDVSKQSNSVSEFSTDNQDDNRVDYNDIKSDNAGYKPTNISWIDDLVKDYKGNIIMGSDFVDENHDGLYSVYTKITKRTLYINDEFGFALQIQPEMIGYTMEISYNDISEPETIRFKNKSDSVVGEINIYPRDECFRFKDLNNWWDSYKLDINIANSKYFFLESYLNGVSILTEYLDYDTIQDYKTRMCGF